MNEITDEEWEHHVVLASRWCYRHKRYVRVFNLLTEDNPFVELRKKSMKVPASGEELRQRRKAIDKAVWGIID